MYSVAPLYQTASVILGRQVRALRSPLAIMSVLYTKTGCAFRNLRQLLTIVYHSPAYFTDVCIQLRLLPDVPSYIIRAERSSR